VKKTDACGYRRIPIHFAAGAQKIIDAIDFGVGDDARQRECEPAADKTADTSNQDLQILAAIVSDFTSRIPSLRKEQA
jgi:hypothetical protein